MNPLALVELLVELEPINRTHLGELLQRKEGGVEAEKAMMLSALSSRHV